MSISSQQLDAFFACSQTGSFTKAAKILHLTQSALSQRILNLEGDLQTTLFIRERNGIRLTSAGQELVQYCRNREALETEVVSRVKGDLKDGLAGSVRIGGFSSVMRSVILPSLQPFLARNPGVGLTFVAKEMVELPGLLQRGEFDYLVLYKEWVRNELEAVYLGEERNVLVEKKGYRGPDVYLDHDENDPTTAQYFKLKKDKRHIRRRFLDDVYGLIDGVKLGLGRAIVPMHLVKNEKEIRIVDEKTVLSYPIVLHFYKQPFYTKLHHLLLKSLAEEIPSRL